MANSESFPPERFMRRVYPYVPCPDFPRTRKTLAIHEAGHAVVMDSIGMPYRSIEIRQDGGEVALDMVAIRAEINAHPDIKTPDWAACAFASMYLAGLQAELHHVGMPLIGATLRADSDHEKARGILLQHFRSIAPLGYCQHWARAVLAQRWAEVEQLGARLMTEGRIEIR